MVLENFLIEDMVLKDTFVTETMALKDSFII